jgi:TRAP-type C4-dicarboxylate transport system permease small subunit
MVLRVIDFINKWILLLLGVLVGVMSLVIILQISSRFVLGIPLPWSEELARLIMAYTIFIGAGVALRHQQLIAVEFLAEMLPDNPRRVLKLIINLIGIAFFVLLFVKGVEMMGKVHTQQSAALRLPMSVFYACIPIGSLLLSVNAVAVIIEMFAKKKGES